MSILNNPGFLKQVIVNLAHEAYDQEVVEVDMEESIGPGLDYESKEEWIQCWLEDKFSEVKKKMLSFKPKNYDEDRMSKHMELSQKIYSMDIGEEFQLSPSMSVMRVPGGWLYLSTNPNVTMQTFVPFNEEFKADFGDDVYGKETPST